MSQIKIDGFMVLLPYAADDKGWFLSWQPATDWFTRQKAFSLMHYTLQSFVDLRILEDETTLQKPARHDPLPFKDDGPEFSQNKPDHEGRGRQKRRTTQDSPERPCQVLIPHGDRRTEIDRAR